MTSRITDRARSAHDRAHDRADLRDTAGRGIAGRDTDSFGAGADLATARTEPARVTSVEHTHLRRDAVPGVVRHSGQGRFVDALTAQHRCGEVLLAVPDHG